MNEHSDRFIHLDASAGISGDMFLGALSDVAAALDGAFSLEGLLRGIKLDGYAVSVRRETRSGITGIKADVETREHHPHRRLSHIREILDASELPARAREKAAEAFTLLAETEAAIHGTTPEEIHFHEVGAIDSIIDITGAMLLMEHLGWPNVISSPVNVGSGTVKCAHGILPVPAPATAALLKGMKIFSAGEPMERTTPTGALLLRLLAGPDSFRDIPVGRVLAVGTGLGSKETDIPNALRATLIEIGDAAPASAAKPNEKFLRDEPSLVEANIDDMNPQDFAPVVEKLLAHGAFDAWCENILMKKARPAVKLCCLCRAGDAEIMGEMMILETTTLGVRITATRRIFLDRATESVETPRGTMRFKIAILGGRPIRKTPEHDDLLRISRESGLPLPVLRSELERETGA
ncbi:MAG: nickel pincer cofactor biosynthesis protein LarC [Synergistaceae bacterium]|nr:nickel pincer cofactor biosynthesis protein LarC [Synergistaceae bacterium]